jgi:hypothetical protein
MCAQRAKNRQSGNEEQERHWTRTRAPYIPMLESLGTWYIHNYKAYHKHL